MSNSNIVYQKLLKDKPNMILYIKKMGKKTIMNKKYIVILMNGIINRLKQENPDKTIFPPELITYKGFAWLKKINYTTATIAQR